MWRVVLSILLLLIALLAVFRAPTNFLWRLSVAVTEFPHIFAALALITLILSFTASHHKGLLVTLNAATLLLYVSPVVRVYLRTSNLSKELNTAFPANTGNSQPFSFSKLFTGSGIDNITPQTLSYKKISDGELTLDFYPARSKKAAPCIIVIHGGSWASGDAKQLPKLNSYLAQKGYAVAAINYRLAPKYQCPAPVEDVQAVLQYLKQQATVLNIDAEQFVLLGRSAGGQIALLAAYTLHDPAIKGVISFYAPADMVYGATIPGNKWVLDTDKVLSDYIGGSYKQVPQKYVESSPIEYASATSPPTLIIHGAQDAMVAYEHSVRLDNKLNALQVKHYFLNLPWATHGCDYNFNGPSGQSSTYAIDQFIQYLFKQ